MFDISVRLDVFKTVVGSFKSLTKTMMYSGLCNYCRMYCFSFSLNFLYWYLDSLCLEVVPMAAQNLSTSPIKFLIDDVYARRLKHLPLPSDTWWPLLLVRPPWTCPRILLLAIALFIVSKAWVVVVLLPSPTLIPGAVDAVYVYRFFVIYLLFLNTVKLAILSSFSVVHNPARL